MYVFTYVYSYTVIARPCGPSVLYQLRRLPLGWLFGWSEKRKTFSITVAVLTHYHRPLPPTVPRLLQSVLLSFVAAHPFRPIHLTRLLPAILLFTCFDCYVIFVFLLLLRPYNSSRTGFFCSKTSFFLRHLLDKITFACPFALASLSCCPAHHFIHCGAPFTWLALRNFCRRRRCVVGTCVYVN